MRMIVQYVHNLIALCKEDKDCHKCYDSACNQTYPKIYGLCQKVLSRKD